MKTAPKQDLSYCHSNVTSIGAIPSHWRVCRLKRIVSKIGSGKTPRGGAETYTDSGVLFLRSQNVHFDGVRLNDVVFIPDDVDREMAGTRVHSNDVLLNITGASLGRCSHVPEDFPPANVSQHVCIIRPRTIKVAPRFLHLAISSDVVQAQIFSSEDGVSREGLNHSSVGDLFLPVPNDIAEQKQIAEFLDRETAKIDSLVAKKERLIALLAEKRTALISHAVAKGLDPNAPMKDSGIEWLGEIPAHWKMKRLKFASRLQTGVTLGKDYGEHQLVARPYLRVANVQDGYLDLETITEIELPPEDVDRYELQPGDVLMTEGGDYDKLGRGYVWENQIQGCLHQNHIFAVRAYQNKLKPRFLAAMLTSSHGKHYFTSTSQQTTNLASTNSTKLRSFPVPLPPIDEQCSILARIGQDSERLDNLIAKVRSGIAKLREYRMALISAAVTGKIDVRGEV